MKEKFWLCKRGRMFYLCDTQTEKRISLHTRDHQEAQRILRAKIETAGKPALGLAMARAYLAAYDETLLVRTWSDVMEHYRSQGQPQTQALRRRRLKSPVFDNLRQRKLLETTSDNFLTVLKSGGVFVHGVMRSLQNLALGLGWLPWPVLAPKLWPQLPAANKRGITVQEHQRILESETNEERRLYYSLLWETGASQSDAVMLGVGNIDWTCKMLSYQRQKTGTWARLTIGSRLGNILRQLPQEGLLFPKLASQSVNARSAEFWRRCKLLGLQGISLHSYRYAFAERARSAGYPERFAQEALGHNSKAVHRAYARKAQVTIPALEDYEQQAA